MLCAASARLHGGSVKQAARLLVARGALRGVARLGHCSQIENQKKLLRELDAKVGQAKSAVEKVLPVSKAGPYSVLFVRESYASPVLFVLLFASPVPLHTQSKPTLRRRSRAAPRLASAPAPAVRNHALRCAVLAAPALARQRMRAPRMLNSVLGALPLYIYIHT